ncbi:MAG: LamB/YcsF family protein [Rhodobacteraceae bacterium]|nr:LamB/YcsF family protein [Paracoccaceae bacterium]MBR9821050.1 LamB/YcsF family protein [Paracoccaceae bacterium]
MTRSIDINSDLGEAYGPWQMGDDAAMLDIVTSANVACGGHASDPDTMYRTLVMCREKGVTAGAHPGFPDRQGFGRRVIPMTASEVTTMVAAQIGALQGIATLAGCPVTYVKPHGALNNFASADRATADAIAVAVKASGLAMLAISGTELEKASRDAGIETISEIFADRGYQENGLLVPRSEPGAMIHDPQAAAERILHLLETGRMQTVTGREIPLAAQSICVHGDEASAVALAAELRARLEAEGVTITAFA